MTSQQELLREAWLGGRVGSLSALSEARAWALREVWRESGKSDHGMLPFIACKVKKVGVGGRVGGCPSPSAISQLFEKINADRDWFPGKSMQESHGPQSVITLKNQAIVARSAMAMKDRGEEVTYPAMVAANKNALMNPETGKPVGKKRLYSIMSERCYDDPAHPEDTWQFQSRASKVALTEPAQQRRYKWALHMQGEGGRSDEWYYRNLVWTDLCNSVLARTEQRHQEMALAKKRGKEWMSSGCKFDSINLPGKPEATKQRGYGAIRVWWAPVLTRGKLHIEILGSDFVGETPEGAAVLVSKVRSALNIRFQGEETPPKTVFTDRGQGFYAIRGGQITPEYKAALRNHSLKPYYGDNAAVQPGQLQEVLLHETAVAWIRYREKTTRMTKPWEETVEQFISRMKGIVQEINDTLDVEGLCRAFPKRLQKLVDAKGDRIQH